MISKAARRLGNLTPGQAATLIQFNATVNLTPDPLPTSKTLLLRKGLNFIPKKTTDADAAITALDAAITRLGDRIRWTTHFQGQAPSKDVIVRLLSKTTFAPPAPTKNEDRFLKLLRSQLVDRIRKRKISHSNYRHCDLRSLYEIACTDRNEILPADKNLGPLWIPRWWRTEASLKLLRDALTYSPCSEARANAICRRLIAFIRRRKANFLEVLSAREYAGLLEKTIAACTNPAWPLFKLMPKIHKLGSDQLCYEFLHLLTGRPVVGAHSAPASPLALFVDAVLKPYAMTARNTLNDSKQLIAALSRLRVPPDAVLGTADIVSLYPNIPTEWGCNAIDQYLRRTPHNGAFMDAETRLLTVDALKLVLNSNVCSFQDSLYLQIKGGAMGIQCIPPYAILVLVMVEQDNRISMQGIIFFKRYIDDLLILAITTHHFNAFITSYMSVRPNDFRLTHEIGDRINFLNLTLAIDRSAGLITFRPYAKNFNKFLYLPFTSHHPIHMKKAFVKGLLSTAIIASSSRSIFYEEASLTFDRLRARGFPLSLLAPAFRSVSYDDRDAMMRPTAHIDSPVIVFNLPFDAVFSSINVGRIIHDSWNRTIATGPHVLTVPVTAWSRTHNVGDLINTARASFIRKEKLGHQY